MKEKPMKTVTQKIFALLLALLMILPVFASCGRQKLDEPIEFIIANDIHYISPTLLGDPALLSGTDTQIASDGKIVHYIPEITDAFIAEVIEKAPKALIIAGDLTLNGALASHEELASKLTSVKDAGIDVLAIPGNHDADKTAVDYSGDTLKEAVAADSAKFAEIYEPLIPETVTRDSYSMSYIYEAAPKLWIIMLDTNTYGQGFVKDETLVWLEDGLKAAKASGIDVISVSHQNLYAHSDMLSFGYQLYNADKLLALYEEYSVQCNFSGHIHIQSMMKEAEVPEIATSSLAITGAHYGEIVYNGKAIDYSVASVDVSAYAERIGSANPDLLDFANYARYYFEEVARSHARERLVDSGYSESDIELMTETYAKINSDYFEGREIDTDAHAEGLALWRQDPNSFVTRYIESMIKSPDNAGLTLSIKFK